MLNSQSPTVKAKSPAANRYQGRRSDGPSRRTPMTVATAADRPIASYTSVCSKLSHGSAKYTAIAATPASRYASELRLWERSAATVMYPLPIGSDAAKIEALLG